MFKSTFLQPPNWKNNFRLETPGLTWLSRLIFPGVCGFAQGSASMCVWSADWFCSFPAKMYVLPAPTQSVKRWEVDGPPQRAWGAVSLAAAPWKMGASGSGQGAWTCFLGTCQVSGPSDAGELMGPLPQVNCPPWSRPSRGLEAVTRATGPSRAAPSDEVGAGDAHPALGSHAEGTGPARMPDSAGTTGP